MTGGAWRRLTRAPGVGLAVVVHLHLLLFALAAIVALTMPDHGFVAADAGDAVVLHGWDGSATRVARDAPVAISSVAGSLTVRAAELIPDYMPPGGRRAVAGFFHDRDRLGTIARRADARATYAGRAPLRLLHGRRRLGDLPLDVWLLGIQAVAIGTLGWWMRLTAPRSLGAWMFGLSCDGVMLAGLSGAVFDARALTADGGLLWAMQILNLVGSNLCATGLMAVFLYLPRPIAPRWVGPACIAAAAVLGVAEGAGLLSLAWFYALLAAPNLAMLAAVLTQWRAAGGDPKARAVLRSVGASSFAGGALLGCGMAIPALFGTPSIASDGMTIFPLALIYGTIAFGIAGARLFLLDTWSYRLAVGAAAALLLLGADALIVRFLDLERPVALAIALLAVGYAYFPLRAGIWRWVTGAGPLARDTLVRQAALVAFAPDVRARRDGWRALLHRVFAPLEIVAGEDTPGVRIERSGEILAIPATVDSEALRLRFARQGTRLFSPADADVARELVGLAREAAAARNSYMSGVHEERRRIARDLHDDVSGLLLTGLHRAQVEEMRGDVRQALGEIRTMVSSLADGARPLDDVLADIRHEAATRLAAAGIALAWQLPPESAPPVTLDYARARALTASLREMVTNVVKHARAAELRVAVVRDAHALVVVVADDGGAAVAASARAPGSGRGLPNVAQRFAELGGDCRIEPDATGFRLRLTLPLC